jgi:hypothetical protein
MRQNAHTPLKDLLQTYELCLRSIGAPVEGWARPGLDRQTIDETAASLGLRLPAEGRMWWQWHAGPTEMGKGKLFGPSGPAITLEEAVETYRESRRIAEKSAHAWPDEDSDFIWNPMWFPIKGVELPVAIDCSVSETDPTPVLFVDWQAIDGFFEPKAASIAEMVGWWIDAIDAGAWEWDASQSRWLSHYDRLDPKLRASPLM